MTTMSAARRQKITSDRAFFVRLATAMTLLALVALAPLALFVELLGGAAPAGSRVMLAPLIQTMLVLVWMLLFIAQSKRDNLAPLTADRGLDRATAGTALALVVLGVFALFTGEDAPFGALGLLPLPCLLLFGALAAAAMAIRQRADLHKRLMLLATLSLLAPAAVRLASSIGRSGPLADSIDGMLIADVFLVALLFHEFRARGRIEPVTRWAGGVFLLAQPLQIAIGQAHAAAQLPLA